MRLLEGQDRTRTAPELLQGDWGPDTLIGGEGNDTASYQDRPNPVTVTLDDKQNDGESLENDNVQTENIIGGENNDTLTDSPTQANTLAGGDGNDTINTATTNGNETSPPDTVNCGQGKDNIRIDQQDQRSSDCETVESGGVQIASIKPKLKLITKKLSVDRRGNTTITLRCTDGTTTHCTGALKLTATQKGRKTTLAKREYKIKLNTTQKLKLKLNRKGLRLLRKQRKRKLNITMAVLENQTAPQVAQLLYKPRAKRQPLKFKLELG